MRNNRLTDLNYFKKMAMREPQYMMQTDQDRKTLFRLIEDAPVVDPEMLPIVRELQKKLARYDQAEAEGRLVELPCKNWMEIVFGEQSIFYMIDTDYIEHPIREITVNNEERFSWYDGWETVYLMGYDENGNYIEFNPEHIGKIIFLTYEEAQAALQRGGAANR